LGEQAIDFFNNSPLEQNQCLSKIYNIAQLGDMAAEAETRIQVATVQAMVKRIFQSDNPPNIDAYDCIIIDKGIQVSVINTQTGEIELAELEDELNFEVEAFNRRVITESFNQVICTQLAQELDPFGDEKTMIFCATDLHSDMVKRLLEESRPQPSGRFCPKLQRFTQSIGRS